MDTQIVRAKELIKLGLIGQYIRLKGFEISAPYKDTDYFDIRTKCETEFLESRKDKEVQKNPDFKDLKLVHDNGHNYMEYVLNGKPIRQGYPTVELYKLESTDLIDFIALILPNEVITLVKELLEDGLRIEWFKVYTLTYNLNGFDQAKGTLTFKHETIEYLVAKWQYTEVK